jgi:serine/threonine-protein kinase
VDSSIPAGWDALLAKLIVKDPSRRLQSAQAVKAALATKDLRPRQVRLPRTAVLAFAAALMTLAAGLGYRAWNGRTGPAVRALAILPFDNLTGDVAQASLAGGLGSALQSDLSVVPALRVVSVAPEESTGPAAELGRKLSVEALARGTLRASGHRLSLSVELIETATGRVYFSKEYQGEAGDLQRIEKEAARATAAALRVPAQDPAVKALAVSTPINAEAYDLFLRAGYHARRDNESDIDQAIALLERSAGLDPAYGPTHSELARAYGTKSFYFHPGDAQLEERGFAALQRAMAIDPNSADTHFARGMMLWRPSQGFPSREALAEFRHAFERRPSFDEAWHQHGVVSLHVGHLATAEKDIDRALSINPANAQARFRYAPILVYQLRYEEAIARLNQVPRQVLPTQWVHQMAWALLSLGRRGEAARFIDDALKAGGADPGGVLHAARAMLHAMAGNRTAAEFDISEAVRVGTGFGHFHHTAYSIGAAYSVMGDYRKAQLWIEKAANDGFPNYALFEKDPHLAGARTTPSFRAFLAKLRQDWEHIPGEPE